MDLKSLYQEKVILIKEIKIKSIVSEVIKHCEEKIESGIELPYVVKLSAQDLNSVHDIKQPLKDSGIVADVCFTNYSFDFEITVTDFI